MPESVAGRYGAIELVLELDIVGILGVLFFLVAEELRVKVLLIVWGRVVFVLLHVVVSGNGEGRDVSGTVVVDIDGVDVLLDRLPGEIISLGLIWLFRDDLLSFGRLLALEEVDAGFGLTDLSALLICAALGLFVHPQSNELDLLVDLLELFHLHRTQFGEFRSE